jgi:hypothetical protein
MFRMRLISFGITVVLLGVLYLWQRERLNDSLVPTLIIYGFALLVGIGWAVGTFLAYRRAKKQADEIPVGIALRIGRGGVLLADQWFAWPDVAVVRSAKGRWPAGPLLEVVRIDGSSAAIPLEQVSLLPATLDTALRAYSAGRQGLDLSTLDI